MRPFSKGLSLALTFHASCIQAWKITDGLRLSYVDSTTPIVPSYNISLPVDHFSTSDTRMFINRYFVNDTYYKPGGPVIFFDFGEIGIEDEFAASYFAGWQGMQSAPLELAKSLNGILIGWEHRYYGHSYPFPVKEDQDDGDESYAETPSGTGYPLDGVEEYRYLTVEQALEDVVYFANRFNQTRLGPGNTVVSGENATQLLGPWDTPWIWVGGSYPGARGAWLRLRNPEVIYAVWASSAVVQIVPDGSAYPNSIYRALPKNCTADVRVAVERIDGIVASGDHDQIRHLETQLRTALGNLWYSDRSLSDGGAAILLDPFFEALTYHAQAYGYHGYTQTFCDYMESFDAPSFLSNSSLNSSDGAEDSVFYWNDHNATPSEEGIAASNGKRGAEVALAAYLFAMNYEFFTDDPDRFNKRSLLTARSDGYDTYRQDGRSWEWQVISELGLIISVNGSSPLALGSKYIDHTYASAKLKRPFYPDFTTDDYPDEPDNRFPAAFGGWNMRPSNVMFTNGEFDPWRAYTVMSLEQDIGAPLRHVTQDIPKCGEPPASSDVFGLIYGGATHAEDMSFYVDYPTASEDKVHPPLNQGFELFIKAYEAWLPCFNSSRGQLATWNTTNATNSTNPDKSGARATSVAAWGWAIMGIFSVILYHAL